MEVDELLIFLNYKNRNASISSFRFRRRLPAVTHETRVSVLTIMLQNEKFIRVKLATFFGVRRQHRNRIGNGSETLLSETKNSFNSSRDEVLSVLTSTTNSTDILLISSGCMN
jgi:hypothetical protein